MAIWSTVLMGDVSSALPPLLSHLLRHISSLDNASRDTCLCFSPQANGGEGEALPPLFCLDGRNTNPFGVTTTPCLCAQTQ